MVGCDILYVIQTLRSGNASETICSWFRFFFCLHISHWAWFTVGAKLYDTTPTLIETYARSTFSGILTFYDVWKNLLIVINEKVQVWSASNISMFCLYLNCCPHKLCYSPSLLWFLLFSWRVRMSHWACSSFGAESYGASLTLAETYSDKIYLRH